MSNFRLLLISAALIFYSAISFAQLRLPAGSFASRTAMSYAIDSCENQCSSPDEISPALIHVYQEINNNNKDSTEEWNKAVTSGLSPGDSANGAASKIADKSLQYWWNTSGAQNTPLGRSVVTAQNSLNKQVLLSNGATPQRLDFTVDAFQTLAKVQYQGFTHAEMFFQARDSSVGVQMIEKLGLTRELVIGEAVRPTDQLSSVLLKWNW